jgi:3-hydroxyisobutyrate dehydrogenase-like beta-hydroxyacid dehydrogenase
MAHIALIGTGLLGSGMARRFLKSGTGVTAWNRTISKAKALEANGARVAATPQDAVAGAHRIHLVLQDDAVVDEVLDQIRPALSSRAIVIDHSTTLPAKTAERAGRIRGESVRFLHAPVFMSPLMAEEGKGLMVVAGPQPVFDDVRSALEGMTGEVWYLGERPDLAAAYKLFGNAMLFAISAGLADIIAMARANGVDPSDAVGLFRRFAAGNAILGRGPKMAAGDFRASFTMTMARKDVGLMLEAADGQPLIALPAVARRMDEVIATGGGDLDLAAIGRAGMDG